MVLGAVEVEMLRAIQERWLGQRLRQCFGGVAYQRGLRDVAVEVLGANQERSLRAVPVGGALVVLPFSCAWCSGSGSAGSYPRARPESDAWGRCVVATPFKGALGMH